jgi:hypothetical protein
VSPIEPPTTAWRPQAPQTLPDDARNYSINEGKQTLKPHFGGPSDWEHFEPIVDHPEGANHLENPTTSAESERQDAWHKGHPVDPSQVAGGGHVTQNFQQLQPDEPVPERSSPVSSVAATSPVVLPVAPAPLSMSRTHRDPAANTSSYDNKETPGGRVVSPHRTGTIDGVIQAWNKPLEGQNSWHTDKPVSSRASSRQSSVSAFSAARPHGEVAETPKSSPRQRYDSNRDVTLNTTNVDPYADLEPEYRASLSRFVAMLRRESEAPSETGKFSIFKAFMDKELRLRSVLYGLDGGGTETANAANGSTVQPSSNTKLEEAVDELPLGLKTSPRTPDPIPITQDAVVRTSTPENKNRAASSKLAVSTSQASNDDSFSVVDQLNDEVEYSPGGRPKVSKPRAVAKNPKTPSPKISAATSAPVTALVKGASSPSDNAPIVVNDYSTGGPESPGRNAPIVVDMSDLVGRPGSAPLTPNAPSAAPLKFQPPRPVYTPFRYTEASRDDLDKLTIQQPAYQAYTAMRQSADSGRILTQGPTTVDSATRQGQDTFLGLIRSQSRAHPSNRSSTPSNLLVKDPRIEAYNTIRALVPKTLPDQSRPPKLAAIYQEMEKIPDEFGFIRETVLRWDNNNQQVREGHDRERQSRQEESERHIDALFNDNEIGYSDIGTMESDFKLAEAKKKYEEEQQELESFTKQVFELVTQRLEGEILNLNAQYVLAMDLLESKSNSASHCMNRDDDHVGTAQVMDVVISLFNKLQVRYQKLAEANFERERRQKKLELTVLNVNGDVAAVKKLEREFRTAEMLQVLHEAQERDTRANKLMDSFDRATARTLGDNQAYVDELLAKLRKMDTLLGGDGKESLQNTFEPAGGLRQTLLQAKAALDFVAADSNAILRASNTADTILNDADYVASVAKAHLANAPEAAYKKLNEEKQKEDAKIKEDLDARLESIAKGPADALSVIEGLIAKISNEPVHQERIERALEAAKMRNANKDP